MFGIQSSQFYLDRFGVHVDLFRYLLVGGMIFTRIFILSLFVPFWGGRPIPGRIRIAFVIAMVLFLLGPLYAASPEKMPEATGVLFVLFLKEVFFGMLLGVAVAMVFYGIQAAGNMIDNQRQLANARIFNPALGSQASLFGVFYYQFALVTFLAIDGHLLLIETTAKSFQKIPLFVLPAMPANLMPVLHEIARLTADTLVIALQLSAPVLVAIFIADLILGLTNRVAPMVNVFEMGFNIKGFVGGILAYLSLFLVQEQMKVWFSRTMEAIQRLLHGATP